MELIEPVFVYALGALCYGGLEMLWRGRTHWTMLVLGGLCFLWIYLVTVHLHLALWKKWLLCAAVITLLEFFSGWLLNLCLGWNIWDYSNLPGNILGQVCPLFSIFWLLLSIPGSALAWLLRHYLFENLS